MTCFVFEYNDEIVKTFCDYEGEAQFIIIGFAKPKIGSQEYRLIKILRDSKNNKISYPYPDFKESDWEKICDRYPLGIYIFVDEKKANEIQDQYGVRCITTKKLTEKIFPDDKSWHTDCPPMGEDSNWKSFLKDYRGHCPSNGLVILDKYFYPWDKKNWTIKEENLTKINENLKELLSSILPEKRLKIPYHILLIEDCPNCPKKNKDEKEEDYKKKIEDYKKKINNGMENVVSWVNNIVTALKKEKGYDYDIVTELVFVKFDVMTTLRDILHDRNIILNYSIIESSHFLNDFDYKGGQRVSIESVSLGQQNGNKSVVFTVIENKLSKLTCTYHNALGDSRVWDYHNVYYFRNGEQPKLTNDIPYNWENRLTSPNKEMHVFRITKTGGTSGWSECGNATYKFEIDSTKKLKVGDFVEVDASGLGNLEEGSGIIFYQNQWEKIKLDSGEHTE